MAWTRPMVTVLLPSPSGVGVILETQTRKYDSMVLDIIIVCKEKNT